MNPYSFIPWPGRMALILVVLAAFGSRIESKAEQIRGFTEPYRSVLVSAAEIGIVSSVEIREGDYVQSGQVIAQLDDRILQSTLRLMQAASEARGAIKSAQAELNVIEAKHLGVQALMEKGNASSRELQLVEGELERARASLLSAEEQVTLRNFEKERTLQQIEQKRLRSPMNGYVVEILKQPGEFISPTEPAVVRVVELARLRCVFTVASDVAASVRPGQEVPILIGTRTDSKEVIGTIEFISPLIDPQSGTVLIKVRLENQSGQLQAGSVCSCQFNSPQSLTTVGLRGPAE